MRPACKLLLLTLALGFPATARATDPGKATTAGKPVVVHFELLKSRHMAVQVKINGKGPYRLIFDTGAPTNLINNRLAKESGVLKKGDKPAMPLFGLGGAKVINVLEVGDLKLDKVPVMVMDHPTVTAISKALGPIDGIVGFPFFARYKT
ncbi:MAG TPA: retropepsin-like aspartic protease, partial [Gemmata sp.]|nr:retropepsin-like aspartic protease [Gemmata sp.]